MVNHGLSTGCGTCKERRVKCDEAKPKCRACQRLQLSCSGYRAPARQTSIRFKDQNYRFRSASTPIPLPGRTNASTGRGSLLQESPALADNKQVRVRARARARARARVPLPLPLPRVPREPELPDSAVPFFFDYYASRGRDVASARGFFETLVPVYRSQRHGSALSLAVAAVASVILSLWRRDARSPSLQWSAARQSYTAAVACLRGILQNDILVEQDKPATMLAVLALQFYENIVALYDYRSPTPIHLNGAVSLLPIATSTLDDVHTGSVMNAYIRKYILHIEISSALRQKRPLQSIAYSWLKSSEPTAAGAANLSMALDVIGASVAEFQATCLQVREAKHDGFLRVAEAQRLDAQLLAWARSVPDHWQPRKLTSTSSPGIDPSIPTYRSVCEVYPSCQIASVWNLWLSQRLILVKIALGSLNAILHGDIDGGQYVYQSELMQPSPQPQNQIAVSAACIQKEFLQHQERLQALVDSVCYSVPFYLGNRTTVSSLADFTNPSILLPSCPDPKKQAQAQAHDAGATQTQTQRDAYRHHMIAKGPWHAMSPLSHLLTLLLEDHGSLTASVLRPGQLAWIQRQFIRVAILLGLPLEAGAVVGQWKEEEEEEEEEEEAEHLSGSGPGPVNVNSKANYLATEVRKGTIFMSGL